jgi:hypothetical protein
MQVTEHQLLSKVNQVSQQMKENTAENQTEPGTRTASPTIRPDGCQLEARGLWQRPQGSPTTTTRINQNRGVLDQKRRVSEHPVNPPSDTNGAPMTSPCKPDAPAALHRAVPASNSRDLQRQTADPERDP